MKEPKMIVCPECLGSRHIILSDGDVQICPTCHGLGKIEETDNV